MTVESKIISDDVRRGLTLYGNDFTGKQLESWVADESGGYYGLASSDFSGSLSKEGHEYSAANWIDGTPLRNKVYPTALVLGCADGSDVLALQLNIAKVIAIEPAKEWWKPTLGNIPCDFRLPNVDGSIELPDESIDLVIYLGVLHHIANVEFVIGELSRAMNKDAKLLIREPITSMGDFRRPRIGLTRHERGIPANLLKSFVNKSKLKIEYAQFSSTPGLLELFQKLGVRPFTSKPLVRVDRILSRIFSFNISYWRESLVKKIAPRALSIIASKVY